jgi:hypothetical protein
MRDRHDGASSAFYVSTCTFVPVKQYGVPFSEGRSHDALHLYEDTHRVASRHIYCSMRHT